MALVDDLKALATTLTANLDGANPAFTREELKQFPFDLLGMKASALQFVIRGTQYMADFTEKIEAKKSELHPWVTVYGAGLGMQAVFNRILLTWAQTPVPGPGDPKPPDAVKARIDEDIPRYVSLIAN